MLALYLHLSFIFFEIEKEVYMLYAGLAVGLVLGSFVTIISLALFKEVSTEQESGDSPFQAVQHGSDLIKREDSPHSAS
jgi:hypothetical protein